ncbi:helix-turn-helix domain-containing protein [Neolewinella antarctica]|uniref:helix-turn-helix domain-containing protein n=1 Tax=Neolewinella antarctica TaxID=442734 RepID=UPI003873974B
MLPFELSQTDIETIKVHKNSHTCPGVRVRLLVLWMIHHKFSYSDVSLAVDCHLNTVTNIVRMQNDGGLERIMRVPKGTLRHPLYQKFTKVRDGLKKACLPYY